MPPKNMSKIRFWIQNLRYLVKSAKNGYTFHPQQNPPYVFSSSTVFSGSWCVNTYCIRWQDMFNRIFTICCSTLNYTFCLCSLRSCRMQNLPLHLVLLLFDSAFESRLTGTRSFSLTALPIIVAHEIKCDSNHLKITSILEKKKRCNGTQFCKE